MRGARIEEKKEEEEKEKEEEKERKTQGIGRTPQTILDPEVWDSDRT